MRWVKISFKIFKLQVVSGGGGFKHHFLHQLKCGLGGRGRGIGSGIQSTVIDKCRNLKF